MSKLWSELAAKEGGLQPFEKSAVQVWRVRAGLYSCDKGERVLEGNTHAGVANVCGR